MRQHYSVYGHLLTYAHQQFIGFTAFAGAWIVAAYSLLHREELVRPLMIGHDSNRRFVALDRNLPAALLQMR